jgi:hypothetical protein
MDFRTVKGGVVGRRDRWLWRCIEGRVLTDAMPLNGNQVEMPVANIKGWF